MSPLPRRLLSPLARAPWWAWIALLALAARLVFLFGAREPILYAHPYNYFHGAQEIVEYRDPWRFVLTRDEWHRWLGPWTIAPLYYLFLAGLMAVFGQHLLPIQLVQIALDASCAVLTALLGRRVARGRGTWAGVAYALNFHAIEQAPIPLTENLHTVLLVGGLVLLVEEASSRATEREAGARGGWGSLLAGAFLIGLSALARAVSTAFVPLAALWRWWLGRDRDGLLRAAAIAAAATAAVLPWTIRNAAVTGDFIPVETNGIYNFYDDNAFVDGPRRLRQEEVIGAQPTLKERRDLAVRFALRGIARNPGLFAKKAWDNLLHLVRPDGLQLLLVVEEPMPWWRHAALLFLDDLIVLPTVVLFAVYLLASRPTPARGYIAAWTAYYMLMVVVVFHNEIRYRSTLLPLALAGAAGGWSILASGDRPRWRVRLALAGSTALVALVVAPYLVPALRALRSLPSLAAMTTAVHRGDRAEAERRVRQAAEADPEAARPFLRYGRALARAGDAAGALEAYARAQDRKGHVWVLTVVRPALLAALGRPEEAARAVAEANSFSYHFDAWLAQETAWRNLPPPVTYEVRLGDGDYGAARGFTLPRSDGRWTRDRAWLRLRPLARAPEYDVTLWMASPEPSPNDAPEVAVRIGTAPPTRFTVGRETRPYRLRVPAPADGVLVARIDAPTWNRGREPAEQGVFVSRMTVEAAGSQ
jgi:tetratricopeptide (TPR) repeat protein